MLLFSVEFFILAQLTAFALVMLGLVIMLLRLTWSVHSSKAKTPGLALDMLAVVERPLTPAGAVLVNGELWCARSKTGAPMCQGSQVVVVGANGHWLEVEPI
jgi:membrane protein implicated in regulation of membrane protease activity